MIFAFGHLFLAFLLVLAAVCVVVAAIAVRDCIRKGGEDYTEFQEWLKARDVTGRVQR
jgi:hypothetical protein